MTTAIVCVPVGLIALVKIRAAARRLSVPDYIKALVLDEAQAASAEEYSRALGTKHAPEAT